MEFRLTYAGELLASNTRAERPARKAYKHVLRCHFHRQLKRLFEVTQFLKTGTHTGEGLRGFVVKATSFSMPGSSPSGYAFVGLPEYDKAQVIAEHEMYGFRFLPLVTAPLKLACWIDVLFLRRQEPGELWTGGDIYNRLKTLFDALTIPDTNQGYETLAPAPDEDSFYCLLENDKLISKVSVETDRLLEDISGNPPNEHDARLVLTVRIQPHEFTLENIMFT